MREGRGEGVREGGRGGVRGEGGRERKQLTSQNGEMVVVLLLRRRIYQAPPNEQLVWICHYL